MYTVYDLIQTPNQKFNTNIGDNNYEFEFASFNGLTYATVRINGEVACAGVRCAPNISLFPSTVNNAAGGIFAFLCLSDDYPSYEQFDGTTTRFAFCKFEDL